MVTAQGIIRKLLAEPGTPVTYELPVGEVSIPFNGLIGRELSVRFTGEIYCVGCGKRTSRSYAQGFCFPCFQDSPQCAPCIIRPDLCRAHEGFGRDMEWEKKHHLCDQIVYFAWTGGKKVGVTGSANRMTRWIDQGATAALVFANTPNRYTAGVLESACRAYLSDRTNWRRMLSRQTPDVQGLYESRRLLHEKLGAEVGGCFAEDPGLVEIVYPVMEYPDKVRSVSFDKMRELTGTLAGIKGQYLIFEDGQVLNIRKHEGYCIELEQ